MNVSLTKELESLVDGKVKSGLYNNASEVIRDAIRRAFCTPPGFDPEQDTPELAAMIREGINSPHSPYVPGEFKKRLKQKLAARK